MSRAKRLGRVSWQAFILGPPCSGWQERFGKTGLGCPSLAASNAFVQLCTAAFLQATSIVPSSNVAESSLRVVLPVQFLNGEFNEFGIVLFEPHPE